MMRSSSTAGWTAAARPQRPAAATMTAAHTRIFMDSATLAPAGDLVVREAKIDRRKKVGKLRGRTGAEQALASRVEIRVVGRGDEPRPSASEVADLGGNDHAPAVTSAVHPAADDRFGFSADVAGNPRGVGGGVGVEHRKRLGGFVAGPAKNIAAQAEREDVQVGRTNPAGAHGPPGYTVTVYFRPMAPRPRLSLFAVATSTLLAAFTASCSNGSNAEARKTDDAATPRMIETDRVSRRDIRRAVDVTGTLAAADQVTISSQSEGVVSRIAVDLGDRIRTGQVMVDLDREKLQYNLDQQRAALARALARYGANGPGELPPTEQTPDVQKAAADLGRDTQAAQRAAELHKKQLIPRQVLDDADSTLRAQQATYDAALQNARNLR